jgi:hypothetical protein
MAKDHSIVLISSGVAIYGDSMSQAFVNHVNTNMDTNIEGTYIVA